MFPSAPHGVLPGLEHYTFGASGGADGAASSHAHAHSAAAEAHEAPLEEETPITVVEEEEAPMAEEKAEVEEVAGESEEESELAHLASVAEQSQEGGEEEAAEAAAELAGEERTMAVDSSLQEGEPTEAGDSFRSLEGLDGAAATAGDAAVVADNNYRRLHRHRRLLGSKARKARPVEEILGELVAKDAMLMKGMEGGSSPAYDQPFSGAGAGAGAGGAAGGAAEQPNQGIGLMPTSSELKAMNLLLNVSVVDSACQFLTKECAEAAAQSLATTLRSDAEAVSNPLVRPRFLVVVALHPPPFQRRHRDKGAWGGATHQ